MLIANFKGPILTHHLRSDLPARERVFVLSVTELDYAKIPIGEFCIIYSLLGTMVGPCRLCSFFSVEARNDKLLH